MTGTGTERAHRYTSIRAVVATKPTFHEPYLDLEIDGRLLGHVAADVLDDPSFCDLVPCLLPWYEDPDRERELQISRERFLPPTGTTTIAPVLMCPDDLDFWCSIVVAEITRTASTVRWTHLGLSRAHNRELPDGVGNRVEWAEPSIPWEFAIDEYQAAFDAFGALPA